LISLYGRDKRECFLSAFSFQSQFIWLELLKLFKLLNFRLIITIIVVIQMVKTCVGYNLQKTKFNYLCMYDF